ncbi:hypothetical protein KKF38_04970 [Patescibacteria group bacterium]|nr:hypothetical protein [Patescibacteria group bacterium]
MIPAESLTPRQTKIRKVIAWLLIISATLFVLYWVALFILVGVTGLPPWKIGVDPWMQ